MNFKLLLLALRNAVSTGNIDLVNRLLDGLEQLDAATPAPAAAPGTEEQRANRPLERVVGARLSLLEAAHAQRDAVAARAHGRRRIAADARRACVPPAMLPLAETLGDAAYEALMSGLVKREPETSRAIARVFGLDRPTRSITTTRSGGLAVTHLAQRVA